MKACSLVVYYMTNYGTDAGARSFAGFPTTEEIDTITMTALLEVGTQRVKDDTAKSDWDGGDSQWNLVNIATEIAAAKLAVLKLTSIDKPNDRIRDLEKIYDEIIQTINNSLPDAGEDNPAIQTSEAVYRSYPLNPDVDPYVSQL